MLKAFLVCKIEHTLLKKAEQIPNIFNFKNMNKNNKKKTNDSRFHAVNPPLSQNYHVHTWSATWDLSWYFILFYSVL